MPFSSNTYLYKSQDTLHLNVNMQLSAKEQGVKWDWAQNTYSVCIVFTHVTMSGTYDKKKKQQL